jgi:hypothetical protein
MNNFNFEKFLTRRQQFSEKTFGPNFNPLGIVDHIKKELNEIVADPNDLVEWIDIILLALDGAARAGYSPEQIINALDYKLTKNENRKWPDWKTVDPNKAIEHVEECPTAFVYFYHSLSDGWYTVKWKDGSTTEYNFWSDAKEAIKDRNYVAKWDGHPDYCPQELK